MKKNYFYNTIQVFFFYMIGCLLASTVMKAQSSFTPVQYNFPNGYGTNSSGYTEIAGQTTATRRFGAQYASSNGYGTWIVTRDGGWALLGDTLNSEAIVSNHPELSVPSGIIASGLIPGAPTTGIKVAANLNGSVRYVWFQQSDPASQASPWEMKIAGFDDHDQLGGAFPTHNINDIRNLSGLPNSGNYHNICGPINVSSIFIPIYLEYSTNSWTFLNLNSSDDTDWRDKFDIAMDAKFLYITFSFKDVNNTYRILTFAVGLDTWRPIETKTFNNVTYPVIFQANGSYSSTGGGTANGRRPTIATNVRNNNTPSCDIAWLDWLMDISNSNNNKFTQVIIKGIGFSTTYSITYNENTGTQGVDPITHNNTFFNYFSPAGNNDFYSSPSHARIICGSVNNNTSQPEKAVYVIGDPGGDPNSLYGNGLWLVCYTLTSNALPTIPVNAINRKVGKYFDGYSKLPQSSILISPFPTQYHDKPSTDPTSLANLGYYIIDEPITAFANPYDASLAADRVYNEFHCLYRILANTLKQDGGNAKPILRIANNNNVGPALNRHRLSSSDPWMALNSPLSQPCSYSGSVNQMGIHIYWDEGNAPDPNPSLMDIWNYKRDLRSFDEPIEEMTLATNMCVVADGRGHNGGYIVGATILPDKAMTLWTDPNFNNSALLFRNPLSSNYWNNAQLQFKDAASLYVGDNTLSDGSHNGAILNLPPNFEIQFSGLPDYNGIAVNPKSKLEFYGLPNAGTSTSILENFYYKGSITLTGTTNGLTPAILNLHGGSVLRIPNEVVLSGSKSTINVLYENSIASMVELYGSGVLSDCLFQNGNTMPGNGGTTPHNYVWRALVCKPLTDPISPPSSEWYGFFPQTQLYLSNTTVKCTNQFSRLEISCNTDVSNTSTAQRKAILVEETNNFLPTLPLTGNKRQFIVDGGTFEQSTFFVANPFDLSGVSNEVSIHDATFQKTPNGPGISYGIYLLRNNTEDYHSILINDCHSSGCSFPIYIDGFDKDRYETSCNGSSIVAHERITVSDNNLSGGGIGITAQNSNISSYSNVISGFGIGIKQTNTDLSGSTVASNSFYCSNNISSCTEVGISLNAWNNYISNMIIDNCGIGLKCSDIVIGRLLHSTITNCTGQGILLENSATLDAATPFSGIGGTAYNTIELNNKTTASTSTATSQIELKTGCKLRARNHNNIVRQLDASTHLNDKFIMYSGSGNPIPIGFGGTGDDILDNDYWATGSNGITTAPHTEDLTPANSITNITFSSVVKESGHSGYYTTTSGCINELSGAACDEGGGGNIIEHQNNTSSEVNINENIDSCQVYLDSAIAYDDKLQYQTAYDAYRSYIESCANNAYSWTYFLNLGVANSSRNKLNVRFEEFRDWLKKVLYYNSDTNFYCADVRQIIGTFAWFNDQRGKDNRGALTVAYFLVKENRCPELTAYFDTVAIPETWHTLYLKWSDTVTDLDHAVFDSTLPTLEDLGLGILRGNPNKVKHFNDMMFGPLVSSIVSIPNPFTSGTKLSFVCREGCVLKFEILDILGKRVYDGGEHVFEKGENTITILGKDLPHGILYGRFVSLDGSAKTIKLRKIE
jgi:hypothetical protein